MRIVMPDGRVIEGTPLQIVEFMRSLAFLAAGTTVVDYVRTTVAQARTLMGVELEVEDGTDEEMAAALVRELVARGLPRRGRRPRAVRAKVNHQSATTLRTSTSNGCENY